jgi:serine/threonine protein kinase
MSKYSAGDYFGALIYRTFEECHEPDFYQLQKKLARNLYLSLAYAPAFWLSKLRQEVGVGDQSSHLLLSYIDRKLSGYLPTWLPRGQIKDLIESSISVVQNHWNHRKQLAEMIEKKTNVSIQDLSLSQKSTLPAVAPYLYQASILQYQNRIKQINQPLYPISICPQVNPFRSYAIETHSFHHWDILATKDGKHYCIEWAYQKENHSAKIAHTLKHSNLIDYEEEGQIEDWQWGSRPILLTLEHLIQVAAPLSVESVVVIALDILQGLSVLHENQLIHGALMPQSILIHENCGLMLTDRLSWQDKPRLLDPERLAIQFWSPEQIEHDPKTSKKSDMWTFGIILYQLLCGALPWASLTDPMAISRAVLSFDIRSRANIPEGLKDLLQGCLCAQSNRFEDAGTALARLEAVAQSLSPLIKAQKLQSAWQLILDEQKIVELVQKTPIRAEDMSEKELLDLMIDRFKDVDQSTITPLFPDIFYLYRRYWNNDSHREQFKQTFESALETFRQKLTQVSPDFLFEQLSILSRQKEALEKRFQVQLAECQSKEEMILKEIQSIAWQALKKSWLQLRLPPELMPSYQEKQALKFVKEQIDLKQYSLTPKSIQPPPQVDSTQATSTQTASMKPASMQPASMKPASMQPTIQPNSTVPVLSSQQIQKVDFQYSAVQPTQSSQPTQSIQSIEREEIALDRFDFSLQNQKFKHQSLSLAPPEALIEEDEEQMDQSIEFNYFSDDEILAAQQAADQAEAMLKEELKTIPPAQRFEKLEEFQQKKEKINQTRPSAAISPVSFDDDEQVYTEDFSLEAFHFEDFDQVNQQINQQVNQKSSGHAYQIPGESLIPPPLKSPNLSVKTRHLEEVKTLIDAQNTQVSPYLSNIAQQMPSSKMHVSEPIAHSAQAENENIDDWINDLDLEWEDSEYHEQVKAKKK